MLGGIPFIFSFANQLYLFQKQHNSQSPETSQGFLFLAVKVISLVLFVAAESPYQSFQSQTSALTVAIDSHGLSVAVA